MTKKVVLAFFGRGANDAIRGQMTQYGNALAELGLSIVTVAMEQAEVQYAIDLVSSGQVVFAITWLGIGQNISVAVDGSTTTQNVWEVFGIPFVKFQGDLPAYYVDLHRDLPRTTVNLYNPEEFVRFRRRWLPREQALTAVMPPLPLAPIAQEAVRPAVRRGGRIVFLKNGNSPAELQDLWRQRLPGSVARALLEMADVIASVGTRAGPFYIGDFVAEYLTHRGFEPDTMVPMVRFFSAQLDDYLRRIKSDMIARSLLDLPVVIQGAHWNHIDFTGHRATLAEGMDYDATQKLYADALAIIDMSPNVDTSPHERVQRAVGSFATVLTNRQGWLETQFPEFTSLEFSFDPDSIRQCAADVLANPERFVDIGIAFGEKFRSLHPASKFADFVVDTAELAALAYGREKPVIQPFFVWSYKSDL